MTGPTMSAGLRRDTELLDALASPEALAGGLGVVRLAELTRRGPSQVSRALAALEAEGLVERDTASRRYGLGWRLYALAARTTEARLVHVAGPALVSLAARTGENASLCRLHGTRVATVLTAEAGGGPARPRFDVDDIPVATTSTGRVLLSERDAAAARAVGAEPAVLERVRAAGYAVVDGEFDPGLAGAAAPVRGFHGGVVAALTVSGPAERLRPSLAAHAAATAAAATDLSARLAARPP
ncbi:IclR family transcriptional regulator C-terminal domain-containing protein [Actinomycetospora lutea]|uniref:IclR family transcriptional regulator n=1 Tax=Actinomycetospora lutea TaxID=663604 RepID=UPI002365238A|nr:IclR family transcriptional regulator C-terminal domain-containing protein [Actinomycetospora lutea]MDD7937015.1 IclR family transcriptional regulator C-terminal domain-containing protein [Actinomycetospora lutea]